jgi:regulator of protease activity HflC (stomatin/prohibitin superfamily)
MNSIITTAVILSFLYAFKKAFVRVPRGKIAVIERSGRFDRLLPSGINLIIPIVDKVRIIVSLTEQSTLLDSEECKTTDGAKFSVDCTIRWMITDAEKAVFSITDHTLALTTAARLLLLEEVARMDSQQLQSDAPAAILPLTAKLRDTALRWGIRILGVEMNAKRV